MKKFILACLPVFFILLCILLYACSRSKPVIPEGEDSVQAKMLAEQAGIDTEKNPGALMTKRALQLQNNARATVIGMLRAVGSVPFSRLVITPPANFDIYLKAERSDIPDYEGVYNKYIEVTGIVTVETVSYGEIQRERYSMTVEDMRVIK